MPISSDRVRLAEERRVMVLSVSIGTQGVNVRLWLCRHGCETDRVTG